MKPYEDNGLIIHLPVADTVCRLSFDRMSLYKHLQKILPQCSQLDQESILKIRIIGKTDIKGDHRRYEILKNKKVKGGFIYYRPPKKYSSVFLRNIRYGLSVFIQHFLLEKKILLLHASSTMYKGKAYLFTGPSGIGKSTIASHFPKNDILSDDIAIIRKINNVYYSYSSSFDFKKNSFINDKKAPLAGIFFIRKGPEIKIKTMNYLNSLNELFSNTNLIYYGKLTQDALKREHKTLDKNISLSREDRKLWLKTIDNISHSLVDLILVTPAKELFLPKELKIDKIFS